MHSSQKEYQNGSEMHQKMYCQGSMEKMLIHQVNSRAQEGDECCTKNNKCQQITSEPKEMALCQSSAKNTADIESNPSLSNNKLGF